MIRKGRPRIHWDKLTWDIRSRASLTQRQLARLLKVSQPAVSFWERGVEIPAPRLRRKLEAIA